MGALAGAISNQGSTFYVLTGGELLFIDYATVGAAISRPCGTTLQCRTRQGESVQIFHICTIQPNAHDKPGGRLVAAPTVAAQKRYRALPRGPG